MNVNNLGPFDATIWGTVSDWISILVTVIAAIFIFKTLKSQIVVQKLQERVTEIEHNGHIRSIKPKFDLDLLVGASRFEDESNFQFLTFSPKLKFILTDNPAKNITYKLRWSWVNETDGTQTFQEKTIQKDFLNYGDDLSISLNVRAFNPNSYVYIIDCNLEFFDIENNKYIQNIKIRDSEAELRKQIGNPILIN